MASIKDIAINLYQEIKSLEEKNDRDLEDFGKCSPQDQEVLKGVMQRDVDMHSELMKIYQDYLNDPTKEKAASILNKYSEIFASFAYLAGKKEPQQFNPYPEMIVPHKKVIQGDVPPVNNNAGDALNPTPRIQPSDDGNVLDGVDESLIGDLEDTQLEASEEELTDPRSKSLREWCERYSLDVSGFEETNYNIDTYLVTEPQFFQIAGELKLQPMISSNEPKGPKI